MSPRAERSEREAERRCDTEAAKWYPEVRRSYPRYDVDCAVVLQPEGSEAALYGRVVNISRGGALIRTKQRPDAKQRYRLVFWTGEEGVLLSVQTCPDCGCNFGVQRLRSTSIWGRVLRQGRGGGGWATAMEFNALIDLDDTKAPTEEAT